MNRWPQLTLAGRAGVNRLCQHHRCMWHHHGMVAGAPTILATTMGFHRGGRVWSPGPVFDLAFDLARVPDRPKLCFVSTAGGDSSASIAGFYDAFSGTHVFTSHLALFDMPNISDVAQYMLAQDVIWVDRGSLVNLVAVWRAHHLDGILRQCWEAGVVLAGESAGSLCWHTAGITDSFGPELTAAEGVGLLPYGNAVHYQHRRKHFHRLMRSGDLPAVCYATDVGAGLVYRGTEFVEAVADRSGAGAYRVELAEDGQVVETALEVRRLR